MDLNEVTTIWVPPLRERASDAVDVAQALLTQWAPTCGKFELSKEAQQVLLHYRWPGNFQELEDSLRSAVAIATNRLIDACHLSEVLSCSESAPVSQQVESLENLERRHIVNVLNAHGGHQRLAARTLAIDRATLYRKLSRFGLVAAKDLRSVRGC